MKYVYIKWLNVPAEVIRNTKFFDNNGDEMIYVNTFVFVPKNSNMSSFLTMPIYTEDLIDLTDNAMINYLDACLEYFLK